MATYHLDYENGSDANNGSSWALAWKTMTSGATAARIAPGDTIKIAKSPAPYSIGNASWVSTTLNAGGLPSAVSITGAADNGAGLIRLTINTTTFTTGDIVFVRLINGTTEARGNWRVTVISPTALDLDGSTFTNAYVSGGTCTIINSKCVELAAAKTKEISDCELIWTGANDGTATLDTAAKEGNGAAKITLDSSVVANTKEAYFATGLLDLSSYQSISFWFKNSHAVLATHYVVKLCSDTAGDTAVDTFTVPAVASTTKWLPITIVKDGGGNLGSNIQSIAIYSGSVAPTNSSNIMVDNFIACTNPGLNLQSLISKNSAEQGGVEPWYAIQSIYNDTIVILDSHPNQESFGGRGYSGTTETVATYARETTKTVLATADATAVQTIMDFGTSNSDMIHFAGGYDTSTDLQTGITFFDGSNGRGYGITMQNNYVKLSYIGAIRYNIGLYNVSTVTTGNVLDNFIIAHNTSHGFTASAINRLYAPCLFAYANGSYGVWFSNIAVYAIKMDNFYAFDNANNAIRATSTDCLYIKSIVAKNNANNGSVYSQEAALIRIDNLVSQYNGSGVYNNGGIVNITNATIGESNIVQNADANRVNQIQINKLNDSYSYASGGIGATYSQASTLTNGSGTEWVMNPSSLSNDIFPLVMSVAKIAVIANKLVTVKAWFKKSHATNITASLVCRGLQISGVANDVVDTKTDDTDEEELVITFTPTESGTVEVTAEAYYSGGDSTVIVDAVTITQAA